MIHLYNQLSNDKECLLMKISGIIVMVCAFLLFGCSGASNHRIIETSENVKAAKPDPKPKLRKITPANEAKKPSAKAHYNLAILPWRMLIDFQFVNEKHVFNAIHKALTGCDEIEIQYTYAEYEKFTGYKSKSIQLADSIVWEKKNFFSEAKPNFDEIIKFCVSVDVDLALLAKMKGDYYYTFEIFLFDIKKNKIYSKKIPQVLWITFDSEIKNSVKSVLDSFFSDQKSLSAR